MVDSVRRYIRIYEYEMLLHYTSTCCSSHVRTNSVCYNITSFKSVYANCNLFSVLTSLLLFTATTAAAAGTTACGCCHSQLQHW
jgi:hypothetical protein